jgi:hypothetical protein
VNALKSRSLFTMAIIAVWVVGVGFNVTGGALDIFTALPINNAAIAAGSLVLISIVFAILMGAPTVQGRKVMDQIDGFKLYLENGRKEPAQHCRRAPNEHRALRAHPALCHRAGPWKSPGRSISRPS